MSSRGARGHGCPPGPSVLLPPPAFPRAPSVAAAEAARGEGGGWRAAATPLPPRWKRPFSKGGGDPEHPPPGWCVGRVFPAASAGGLQRRTRECTGERWEAAVRPGGLEALRTGGVLVGFYKIREIWGKNSAAFVRSRAGERRGRGAQHAWL